MNNGKICISVCAETADELIKLIKCAEDLADVIEIRFDCLNHLQFKKFLFDFQNLKQKNFLATFRPKEQGGKREISLSERRKFWEFVSNASNVIYCDIEPDLQKKFARLRVNSLISSFHDFQNSTDNLTNTYEELAETDPEIIKIAVRTDDITDTIPIWKLLGKAKSENKEIIPIAMGECGKWTRILGLAHGAFMTYAALDAGRETAPGQVSARDLTEVYRAKQLNEETEVYGVIAGNSSYSMSPYIHNAAFKFHKLNAVFVPLQVGDLDGFLRRMVNEKTREIELNFKGFAVTNPHKQAIIKHLDEIDEIAGKIGAVNTVKIENGKLYGSNTDANGFIAPLKNAYGDLKGARVAVFGSGGAARACIYALKQENAEVTIIARNIEKAEILAEECKAQSARFKTENENYNEFDILVNATPLGTKGEFEDQTVVSAAQIETVKLVYDLVYSPFQTKFMREADKVHVPKIGGLAMLIAQASEQQKIWTGKDAPLKEMSRAALDKLK